ncbi:MAG TPA: hypothetical protein VJM32_02815 [Candidatus Saccharimonadales bacterium]|nr:hypothetical protein [Candidatus Saccharimonadales bacterium]
MSMLQEIAYNGEIQPTDWHPRDQYLNLDKGFGAVPTDQLLRLSDVLEASSRPDDLEYASTALIEATILSPYRNIDTIDDSIFAIDYAMHLMEQSAQGYWDDLERGFQHPDDQTKALRAEVHLAFGSIYRDLVCGEITDHSRDETYTKLVKIGRYSNELSQYAQNFGQKAAGLTFEIATLLGGLTDDGVLTPSMSRAGSGHYNSHATYDFNYLQLDEHGYVKVNTPVELKSEHHQGRRLKAESRYSPRHVVLVHSGKDLNLHARNLPRIFGHRSLTQDARRELVDIRAGLYGSVTHARREYSD